MSPLLLTIALTTVPAFADDGREARAASPDAWTAPPRHRSDPEPVEVLLIDDEKPQKSFFHGFRLGYTYINARASSAEWNSRLRSPHLFVLGYESMQVIDGGGMLDVIMVANVSVSGLNQNMLIPSGNLLVGFQIGDEFQVGTGVNLTLGTPKLIHQVIAAGWTPKAGSFNVPIHFLVIPDVDGHWRVGATLGVNW
jgi:hypothetical protein